MTEADCVCSRVGNKDNSRSFMVHFPKRRESTGARAADVCEKPGESTDDALMKLKERLCTRDRFPLLIERPTPLFGKRLLDHF